MSGASRAEQTRSFCLVLQFMSRCSVGIGLRPRSPVRVEKEEQAPYLSVCCRLPISWRGKTRVDCLRVVYDHGTQQMLCNQSLSLFYIHGILLLLCSSEVLCASVLVKCFVRVF
jgi:hypothetical protein